MGTIRVKEMTEIVFPGHETVSAQKLQERSAASKLPRVVGLSSPAFHTYMRITLQIELLTGTRNETFQLVTDLLQNLEPACLL